jgi:hypothetical protein
MKKINVLLSVLLLSIYSISTMNCKKLEDTKSLKEARTWYDGGTEEDGISDYQNSLLATKESATRNVKLRAITSTNEPALKATKIYIFKHDTKSGNLYLYSFPTVRKGNLAKIKLVSGKYLVLARTNDGTTNSTFNELTINDSFDFSEDTVQLDIQVYETPTKNYQISGMKGFCVRFFLSPTNDVYNLASFTTTKNGFSLKTPNFQIQKPESGLDYYTMSSKSDYKRCAINAGYTTWSSTNTTRLGFTFSNYNCEFYQKFNDARDLTYNKTESSTYNIADFTQPTATFVVEINSDCPDFNLNTYMNNLKDYFTYFDLALYPKQ